MTDENFEQMGTTGDEGFDFSGDGLPTGDHTWAVTEFEVLEKDNGTQHAIKVVSPTAPFPITLREWVKHTKEIPQRIGRGKLKQIATAFLGQPKYTATSIIGAKAVGYLSEDAEGFARITKWRPVAAEVAEVVL